MAGHRYRRSMGHRVETASGPVEPELRGHEVSLHDKQVELASLIGDKRKRASVGMLHILDFLDQIVVDRVGKGAIKLSLYGPNEPLHPDYLNPAEVTALVHSGTGKHCIARHTGPIPPKETPDSLRLKIKFVEVLTERGRVADLIEPNLDNVTPQARLVLENILDGKMRVERGLAGSGAEFLIKVYGNEASKWQDGPPNDPTRGLAVMEEHSGEPPRKRTTLSKKKEREALTLAFVENLIAQETKK